MRYILIGDKGGPDLTELRYGRPAIIFTLPTRNQPGITVAHRSIQCGPGDLEHRILRRHSRDNPTEVLVFNPLRRRCIDHSRPNDRRSSNHLFWNELPHNYRRVLGDTGENPLDPGYPLPTGQLLELVKKILGAVAHKRTRPPCSHHPPQFSGPPRPLTSNSGSRRLTSDAPLPFRPSITVCSMRRAVTEVTPPESSIQVTLQISEQAYPAEVSACPGHRPATAEDQPSKIDLSFTALPQDHVLPPAIPRGATAGVSRHCVPSSASRPASPNWPGGSSRRNGFPSR